MNGLPLPKSSADFPDNPEYEYPKSEKDVVIALPYCLYKESFSPLIRDCSFSMILFWVAMRLSSKSNNRDILSCSFCRVYNKSELLPSPHY